MGGIVTSLSFSALEAWLVGEVGREGVESSLGQTFGLVSVLTTFVLFCLFYISSIGCVEYLLIWNMPATFLSIHTIS